MLKSVGCGVPFLFFAGTLGEDSEVMSCLCEDERVGFVCQAGSSLPCPSSRSPVTPENWRKVGERREKSRFLQPVVVISLAFVLLVLQERNKK